ncbi:hypothetical protein ACFVOO_16115 [Streptomyces rochei]|uniref:hypothetical protein n=1 Tax=Streptomyces rochei TaxID=1928 RepID=UPI00367CB5B2
MTDQPQHGDRVRITYDGTWWKSRSGITAVRTVHDGDDDWLTAVPDNASVQVLPTGPAATEATEPGRCCGKPAGAICVHDVTHLPTPERHAADRAAETVRVSLAELYGPMADLDHPQHPVNVEPHRFTVAPRDPAAEQAAEERAREMADQHEKTARVFAALHRSAEDTVTRVIALYEQWVKAGPPPLGTSTARWWDARLVELHNALQPADQTTEK